MTKTNSNPYLGLVAYQIYPRSFKDSDGDGVGDIPGIIEKLDYLENLGVDAIWLTPFYKSPMADFGYDVADYKSVDPLFGTMQDFNELINRAHQRGIKVIIDLVLNHTSDHHPWFRESKRSRLSKKRDWYVWRDAKPDGSAPNNWLSVFGGSAWEWDAGTRQYYLHTFLKQQPDLNWHNPEVRAALFDIIRFWLNKGVDVFRLDAVYWIAKDEHLRDDPLNPDYIEGKDEAYNALLHANSRHERHLFPFLRQLTEVVGEYPNRFILCEAYPTQLDVEGYDEFYDKVNAKLLSPFNFEAITLPWNAREYKKYFDEFQASLGRQDIPVYVLGNHDKPRIASRIGRDAARTAAMLQMMLPGLPFIYNGDELGMTDGRIPKSKIQDPWEKNLPGMGMGRDPQRTPMPWSAGKYAGFSTIEPWLPINSDYKKINVAEQESRHDSMLNLYAQLLRLRRNSEILKFGDYEPVEFDNKDIYAFRRTYHGASVIVLLNFSNRHHKIAVPGSLIASTHSHWLLDHGELRPHEGRIFVESN